MERQQPLHCILHTLERLLYVYAAEHAHVALDELSLLLLHPLLLCTELGQAVLGRSPRLLPRPACHSLTITTWLDML